MFWVDLSQANLIEGQFNNVTSTGAGYIAPEYTGTVMPFAKIGNSNSIYVWSGGWASYANNDDGKNYFGIANYSASITGGISSTGVGYPVPQLSVIQANAIDSKIDDGLPQAGRVVAIVLYNATPYWAAGNYGAVNGNVGEFTSPGGGPSNVNTPASAITCYDNGNVNGATQKYSLGAITNKGENINCGLSFQFQ